MHTSILIKQVVGVFRDLKNKCSSSMTNLVSSDQLKLFMKEERKRTNFFNYVIQKGFFDIRKNITYRIIIFNLKNI